MHHVPNLNDTGLMATVRPKAYYDPEQFRFVITPLFPRGVMPLHKAFVAIKNSKDDMGHHITWKDLAAFCGITQSEAFKVAYCSPSNNCAARKHLQPYLVIDVDRNVAYFYRRDKMPEGIKPIHIGPKLINTEGEQTIVEKIPTKVISRVKVVYPYTDSLIMTLQPDNGYLLGVKDITLAQPNHTYVVAGSARTLTDMLTRIHFVATQAGDASVLITINDGSNQPGGIVSTTVRVKVAEGVSISVPELIVPENQKAILLEESSFDSIQVKDEDQKFMQLRITPFGCKIINFANNIHPLLPGNVRNVYGRPDTINEDIAHLAIVPSQENAQIGLELICDTTKIRKYMRFEVAVPGSEEEEGDEPDNQTPDTDSNTPPTEPEAENAPSTQSDAQPLTIQADAMQVADAAQLRATQQLAADTASGNIAGPTGIVGETGSQYLLNFSLPLQEYEGPITVTMKPIRCTLTGHDGTTVTHNKTLTMTGSYDELKPILEKIMVTVGENNGRVDIKYNGVAHTIQVEVSKQAQS